MRTLLLLTLVSSSLSASIIHASTEHDVSNNENQYTATIVLRESSLILTPYSGWRELTITNQSNSSIAFNVAADLSNALTDAGVTQYGGNCSTIMPGNSCKLAFILYYNGTDYLSDYKVSIHGNNTNILHTTISIARGSIGDVFGGGKVACLSSSGIPDKYKIIISASSDNTGEYGTQWGGFHNGGEVGAYSDDNGKQNTTEIIGKYGNKICDISRPDCYIYAAKVCSNYEIDSQGNSPCKAGNTCFRDWYLPAKNELNCLWQNKIKIGGFNKSAYWSSTELPRMNGEVHSKKAWWQDFDSGSQMPVWKHSTPAVRCVRQIMI